MPEASTDRSADSTARIIGYTVVFALFCFAIWLSTVLLREARHPGRTIRVQFPELGTLIAEDPVVQDGVPIGRVKNITLENSQALAEIELFRRDAIPEDSRFVNFNYSLMGARMIVLFPGQAKTSLDESTVQTGFFMDGVAESLRRMNNLLLLVMNLRAELDRLANDSNAVLSPVILNRLNDGSRQLNQLAEKIDREGNSLRSGLESWTRAGRALQAGLAPALTGGNAAENHIESFLASMVATEQQADAFLNTAEKWLQDSTGRTSLLSDRMAYDHLKSSVSSLDTLVKTLQGNGPHHHIVGWKNLHFFK